MIESQHSTPDFISDRGPADYFHGREKILNNFKTLAKKAVEAKGGSTFLIQGAPGAGKSALLYELEMMASQREWEVVDLKHPAPLWDSAALRDAIGVGKVRNVIWGVGNILTNKYTGTDLTSNMPKATASVIRVLEKRKAPLLLVLDEAQLLNREYKLTKEQEGITTSVVSAIHNGKLNTPVILLTAGLGTTSKAFESLGISRFKGGCFVELRALSKESERAVIGDWLTKAGGAKGDPSAWIDAIAQKAHGWPQHILSYVKPAKDCLIENNGIMTDLGLAAVLEAGERGREAYYKQRVKDFDGDEVICLSEVIADIGSGMPFKKELVEAPLIKKYGTDKAGNLFQKFLEKGVIAADGFLYSVPIPSMHDWMKLELKRTQERLREMVDTQDRDSPRKTGRLGAGGDSICCSSRGTQYS